MPTSLRQTRVARSMAAAAAGSWARARRNWCSTASRDAGEARSRRTSASLGASGREAAGAERGPRSASAEAESAGRGASVGAVERRREKEVGR